MATSRTFSKVAVVGAAGGIGQPLSMLLKNNNLVSELNLFDLFNTEGVAADISHIDTPAKVTGFTGEDGLRAALEGADHVVIPAGMPRKPGMTRDDLFGANASIAVDIANTVAEACPNAFVSIITNPVNSTVPIFAAVLEKRGVYNPKKLAGVTHLDVQRANTFVAEAKGLDVNTVDVPVIGGHAGTTILPLLSKVPGVSFSDEELAALTHRIQFGGDEVVKEKGKGSGGSATVSTAYAAAQFVNGVLEAEHGKEGVQLCAYVQSDGRVPGLRFFAAPCLFGRDGIESVVDYGNLSDFELETFDEMLPALEAQIAKGFAHVE